MGAGPPDAVRAAGDRAVNREQALERAIRNVRIDGRRRMVKQSLLRPGQWYVGLGKGKVSPRAGDLRLVKVAHEQVYAEQHGWIDLGPVRS